MVRRSHGRAGAVVLAGAVLLAATACTAGSSDPGGTDAAGLGDFPRRTATPATSTPDGRLAGTIAVSVRDPDRCDPLDERHCLLPFPSDTFTLADAHTDTGRRIALQRDSMPVNAAGVHVDPTEWNRSDGFSPGQAVSTFVPGLDLAKTGTATVGDIAASLDDAAPIVLLDADTGERIPHWAELDASVEDDADRVVYVRPAVDYPEGHRIVVAMRRLRDANGRVIEPGDVFRAYRDRLATGVAEIEGRRARYERVFADLTKAGIESDDLYLAWDFTVASERSLTERMLHLRDDAFARLGDSAPAFTVDSVESHPAEHVARRVSGTFEVPGYLTGGGAPGGRFEYDPDGLPEFEGTFTAPFTCIVPEVALSGPGGTAVPARPSLYGHGLLGNEGEVGAGNVRAMADEHDFVFCATRWAGMSGEDIPNAAGVLGDLSGMATIADRGQQGILDFLFLGRLMIHESGFVTHPAFQDARGTPVIDTRDLFYDGNSQGGIMGGAATAVATDWTRASLGVTGMNYSTLLQRSSDWAPLRAVYDQGYPDEIERGLGLSLMQMLWDRAETNGYAQHLTDDPLPGTPAHRVLMQVAVGDHQVSTYAAEVEARTIGARVRWPAAAAGRMPGADPFWGIPRIESYPYGGSAIVFWDSGSPPAPTVNLPAVDGPDPHEHPRNDPDARRQKAAFLATGGTLIDVCGGAPCLADPVD